MLSNRRGWKLDHLLVAGTSSSRRQISYLAPVQTRKNGGQAFAENGLSSQL